MGKYNFQSGEPYEDTIRKVLRGIPLDEALESLQTVWSPVESVRV